MSDSGEKIGIGTIIFWIIMIWVWFGDDIKAIIGTEVEVEIKPQTEIVEQYEPEDKPVVKVEENTSDDIYGNDEDRWWR